MADQHSPTLVDADTDVDPGTESDPVAFLTLGHVLTGIAAEQVPPRRLEGISYPERDSTL